MVQMIQMQTKTVMTVTATAMTTVLRCLRMAQRWLGATLTRRASEAMCAGRHYIVLLLIN